MSRSTDGRRWVCQCGGVLRVRRGQTPEQVRKAHAETCPAKVSS